MLKLDNPVSFTVDEQNHISNVLMPLGKKGWSKSDRKTKNHCCPVKVPDDYYKV